MVYHIIDWTAQPCPKGHVRVTLPHLPHGAYGPAKHVRRTMLPWFVGLQKDLEMLEVTEAGTWKDLADAHRDLVAASSSPSGLANRYGVIPFAFPAAIELDGLGALSDAMVCRRRHDKASVVSEKKVLLHGTDGQRDEFIRVWRQRTVNRVIELFEEVQAAERLAFGSKSCFFRLEQGRRSPVPDDDPDPNPDGAEDVRPVIHGFEEAEAGDEDDEEDVSMEGSED